MNVNLECSEPPHDLNLEALVALVFLSGHLAATEVTFDLHLGAIVLDVFEQLSSSHVLVLLPIANVAPKLGTLKHCVLLKLQQGPPDDGALGGANVASVWELTEINTVPQNLIDTL